MVQSLVIIIPNKKTSTRVAFKFNISASFYLKLSLLDLSDDNSWTVLQSLALEAAVKFPMVAIHTFTEDRLFIEFKNYSISYSTSSLWF